MFDQLQKSVSSVATTVTDGVGSVVSTASSVIGSPTKEAGEGFVVVDSKEAERQARMAAAQAEAADTPAGKAVAKAKEFYAVAADWTEANVAPHVSSHVAKAKDAHATMYATLESEGMFTKEAVLEAYDTGLTKAKAPDTKLALSAVVGQIPFLDKIPSVEKYVDFTPDPTACFVLWDVVCLALGLVDVSLFALVHSLGDASQLFLYLPMYAFKLAFDYAVCAAIAYALYFVFVKSASTVAMQVGLGFLAFVALKALLVGLMTCAAPGAFLCMSNGDSFGGLLQFVAFVANAVLLYRAYVLYKSPVLYQTPYKELDEEPKKEEEDAVLVGSTPQPSP